MGSGLIGRVPEPRVMPHHTTPHQTNATTASHSTFRRSRQTARASAAIRVLSFSPRPELCNDRASLRYQRRTTTTRSASSTVSRIPLYHAWNYGGGQVSGARPSQSGTIYLNKYAGSSDGKHAVSSRTRRLDTGSGERLEQSAVRTVF